MKIITISGPCGAGKDAVILEVVNRVCAQHSNILKKALATTTRKPRFGEIHGVDILFATENEFVNLSKQGRFIYQTEIGGEYHMATSWVELSKSNTTILNIDPKGAEVIEEKIKSQQGKVFKIFLYSDLISRKQRISRRDGLQGVLLDHKIATDLVKEDPKQYKDFDLVVENKEGEFERTVNIIVEKVKEFIQ